MPDATTDDLAAHGIPRPPMQRTRIYIDVANTLTTPGTTGLQRVTRSLIAECQAIEHDALATQPRPAPPSHNISDQRFPAVIPVVWCDRCNAYRALSDSERQVLRSPLPATSPRLDRLPRALQGLAVRTRTARTRVKAAARRATTWVRGQLQPATRVNHAEHAVAMEPQDWFVDIEAAWWDRPDREALLETLTAQGVLTGVLIADLFPITEPEWSDRGNRENFPPWATAHLRHASALLAISQYSLDQALQERASLGLPAVRRTQVVPLGSDFEAAHPRATSANGAALVHSPYLLCVSTIEPRKNYEFALDVFDLLAPEHPQLSLVIVGKRGWKCEATVERIEGHELFGTRLRWMQTVADDELAALYNGALLTLSTSHAEGYGLAIAESLGRGTPVIASTGGAQREAGQHFAEYPPAIDASLWAAAVSKHLDSDGRPSEHNRERRALVAQWQPPTWQAAAQVFLSTFTETGTN